ncbi:MAG TPA: hypothetical protein VG538_18800 [Vicinamibacterales bacterium]|nr:hypothetical protein [Vicinamibacterales bacterium]
MRKAPADHRSLGEGGRRSKFASALVVTLVLSGVAACRTTPPTTGATVDRFDVDLTVEANRDVLVREDLAIRLDAGAARFERRVSKAQVDGLTFVSATADGRPVTPGDGTLSLSEADGVSLDAAWRFDPSTGASHAVTLVYRATGALAVNDQRGRLQWPAVPAARAYAVGSSRVTLHVVEGVLLFHPSGMAERGWTVTRTPDGIQAVRDGIAPDEPGTVLAEVSIPETLPEPRWQFNGDRQLEFIPAFVSAALFIIVCGLGAVWMIRMQHPRRNRTKGSSDSGTSAEDWADMLAGLHRAAIICIVVGVATGLAMWLWMARFGPWQFAVPASVVFVAIVLEIGARVLGR